MKIGITFTGRDDKHSNYVRWIRGNDSSVEVIKLTPGINAGVEGLDGIVLSGGVDIHPGFFGGRDEYDHMPRQFWKERDEFEFSIFKNAVDNRLPVLGVCRGLQLINVSQQGTLVQDLNIRNQRHESFTESGIEKDRTHKVVTEKNSLLHSITASEGLVNSAHHQSIDKLGSNLVVNSYSEDGVIEGVEWKDKNDLPFMLAVQWHPERMDKAGLTDSPFSRNIRDRFLSEVKLNAGK